MEEKATLSSLSPISVKSLSIPCSQLYYDHEDTQRSFCRVREVIQLGLERQYEGIFLVEGIKKTI